MEQYLNSLNSSYNILIQKINKSINSNIYFNNHNDEYFEFKNYSITFINKFIQYLTKTFNLELKKYSFSSICYDNFYKVSLDNLILYKEINYINYKLFNNQLFISYLEKNIEPTLIPNLNKYDEVINNAELLEFNIDNIIINIISYNNFNFIKIYINNNSNKKILNNILSKI